MAAKKEKNGKEKEDQLNQYDLYCADCRSNHRNGPPLPGAGWQHKK